MPPNTIELPVGPDPEMMRKDGVIPKDTVPPPLQRYEENYKLKILQSSVNLLTHIFVGMVVAVALLFAFRNGIPLGATPMHIVLCVIGYQLLMAEAILSLSTENGWSSKLRLVDKRRAHWILQILGSGLAIGGSFHKILDKTVHWDTLHGQFGLVALVFTSVSMVNGLASLWAYELRRMLPGNISKITHICFGTVAFGAACITLCYGLDKAMFRNWATDALAHTCISVVAMLAFLVIFYPLLTFYTKSKNMIQQGKK